MRVLISGGGIAGLTVAYWLHQYGCVPVVIDQAEEIRRDGYAIDFLALGTTWLNAWTSSPGYNRSKSLLNTLHL